ncbi:MAG: transposase [Chromatiales bacterium]|nr:transposase [Chromatiales bacterium]
MARPLRIEFPGGVYHVTSRGNRGFSIFQGEADRTVFLDVLAGVHDRFRWLIHAYCLLDEHYHLLIETPEANLSAGMRQLNGVYTQSVNRRHDSSGHVFQGRYKAILVQKDSHLLRVSRHIALNPVRVALTRSARDWKWGSYRALAGLAEPPAWMECTWTWEQLAPDEKQAQKEYRAYVKAGRTKPPVWEFLTNQIFLGEPGFADRMREQLDVPPDRAEIPSAQLRPKPPPLSHFEAQAGNRDHAIAAAYASGGYTMKEIGAHFGLHYSQVSRIIRSIEKSRAECSGN